MEVVGVGFLFSSNCVTGIGRARRATELGYVPIRWIERTRLNASLAHKPNRAIAGVCHYTGLAAARLGWGSRAIGLR